MRKMPVKTTLALLLFLVLGSTVAYASFNWCPDDPTLTITPPGGDPTIVNVWIHPDPEGAAGSDVSINGTTMVKVHVPKNVDAVCDPGKGWDGYDETCEVKQKGKVKDGEIKLEVKVKVPATEKIPVRVTLKTPGDGSATCEGWSNDWVKCKVELEVEDGDGHHGDHDDRDDDH